MINIKKREPDFLTEDRNSDFAGLPILSTIQEELYEEKENDHDYGRCQKTPEDAIVKEKGASSIKNYQSTENTGTSLRETIKAPEHYTNKETYENGALVIDTDAEVILPEASSINTYEVSARVVNFTALILIMNGQRRIIRRRSLGSKSIKQRAIWIHTN